LRDGQCQVIAWATRRARGIFCGFGNTKFDDAFGWNLDLLLRLWIKARASLPFLLHQLAKTGQDKSAGLFNLLVGNVAERIGSCGIPKRRQRNGSTYRQRKASDLSLATC
jgi:hypothetical protein